MLAPFALDERPGTLPPLQVDAETPYLLTYTSGTTGAPKGVVHVQGGFLVSIAREAAYQADVHEGDVMHFATDMGWIMGPWTLVGAGALGGTIVFAEGAPDWPTPDRLWRTVESERVTSLGLSPTLARALLPHGAPTADLSSLRTFVTTGEPWNPEPYRWLFEEVGGGRVPVINCSGGTEVGACFLSPTVAGPIKACSVGGPALGMAMDVVDEHGASLVGSGEVGELVCRRPFPGMTRGFWRDPQKYLDAYWSRLPGRVGARRLGVGRPGRLLVPPRPLRRHVEHRRQADRPGRARVRGRRPSGRARGGGDRRAARREGRNVVDLLLPAAGSGAERCARAGDRRDGRGPARQGLRPGARDLRRVAAPYAVGEDRPPGGASHGARDGSRRSLVAREPRVAHGNRRGCRLMQMRPNTIRWLLVGLLAVAAVISIVGNKLSSPFLGWVAFAVFLVAVFFYFQWRRALHNVRKGE